MCQHSEKYHWYRPLIFIFHGSITRPLFNMAENLTANGPASALPPAMTAAQKLQEKHQVTANHHTEIEDVVDEDDIQHPPPSTQHVSQANESTPNPPPPTESLSEKAAGKRKVEPAPSLNGSAIGGTTLNTQSEEAFPALGSGPKSSAPPPSMAWGARRPVISQNGVNGVNGHLGTPSLISSRASTPTSGAVTPSSTSMSAATLPQSRMYPPHMPLPGRHKERIQLAPSQLLPRNQLKKPLQEILRAINKSSKATVDMRTGPGGNVIFEATGPVDAARQALKTLASQVGSTVSDIVKHF